MKVFGANDDEETQIQKQSGHKVSLIIDWQKAHFEVPLPSSSRKIIKKQTAKKAQEALRNEQEKEKGAGRKAAQGAQDRSEKQGAQF